MDNIDEHLIERLKFDSNIFDTIVSQYAAVYIRHTVWKNINGFDEEFVHPSYVIMDFQLRVLKGGYRNTISFDILLKSDSMIESKKGIGINDLNVFRDKWGIHYLNDVPNKSLIDMVTEIDMPIHNILEVGCASGYNLIELKNIYPDAALYGLELNERAVDIARCIANVECGNVETDGIPFGDVKFDVIIFGDVLEHLKDPEATVRMCSDRLSVNGRIVCSIPNIQHISVLNALIHGRFTYADLGLLDKTHIHFFTLYEIQQMFENLGYKIENILYTLTYMSQDDYNAIYILKHAFPEINEKEMQAFQYVVRVVKKM
jgi:2-polyprenyl-3-methyl-5-hydroxy-6-metoxy-1,4-benzoquinol methylase